MYYPCSENKGADQLRGYREADLRLCFRIGNNPVFSRCGLIITAINNVVLFCLDVKMKNKYQIGKKCLYKFAQNINCWYTLEPSRHGGSNVYPQSTFWIKNKKDVYLCNPCSPL